MAGAGGAAGRGGDEGPDGRSKGLFSISISPSPIANARMDTPCRDPAWTEAQHVLRPECRDYCTGRDPVSIGHLTREPAARYGLGRAHPRSMPYPFPSNKPFDGHPGSHALRPGFQSDRAHTQTKAGLAAD